MGSAPLSKHALATLRDLVDFWRPTQEINAGVVGRLLRDGLIVLEMRPSPFRSHKPGTMVRHAKASAEGEKVAKESAHDRT